MDDQLVRRLHELEWPKPPDGLRERSLEEFQRRLGELEGDAETRAASRER